MCLAPALLLNLLQNENEVWAEVLNQVQEQRKRGTVLALRAGGDRLKRTRTRTPDHSEFFKSSLLMWLHLWTLCLTKIKPVLSSPWNVIYKPIFCFPKISMNVVFPASKCFQRSCLFFVCFFFWSSSATPWINRMVGHFRALEINEFC